MAVQTLSKFEFPYLTAVIYYDDITLDITRVEVNNMGNNPVLLKVVIQGPPKKTFSQVFQPGTNVGYDIPPGFKFTVQLNDQGELEIISLYDISIGGV